MYQKIMVPLSKLAQRTTVKGKQQPYNSLLKPTAFHAKGTSGPKL